MKITWIGHATFLIENARGEKLLMDPAAPEVGYKSCSVPVNLVTESHQHYDHNYTEGLLGCYNVISEPGNYEYGGFKIFGIPSYHDDVKGAKRGNNIIFVVECDNYRLCHLGDLGHELEDSVRDLIGTIDVLMIPVGGNFTIDGKTAAKEAQALAPHVVLPMHYKTSRLSFPLSGVEDFLIYMKQGEKLESSYIDIEGILTGFTVKILKPL